MLRKGHEVMWLQYAVLNFSQMEIILILALLNHISWLILGTKRLQ